MENMQRYVALDKLDSQNDSDVKVADERNIDPTDEELTQPITYASLKLKPILFHNTSNLTKGRNEKMFFS